MPASIPIIITLGLGIFTFFALGGTLFAATVGVLGNCITVTVALAGMPLAGAGIVNTILNTVLGFIFAS